MLKAFIDAKDEAIKGHNLGALAESANFSRRLKAEVRVEVDAAILEATPMWRNLFRYATLSDLRRMGREFRLRFEVDRRVVTYTSQGDEGLRFWAERLFDLAPLIVQEGQVVWRSKKR